MQSNSRYSCDMYRDCSVLLALKKARYTRPYYTALPLETTPAVGMIIRSSLGAYNVIELADCRGMEYSSA